MQYFVFFDGAYHPLGEDETTSCCGVVIPHTTPWVAAVPEKAIEHTADAPKAEEAPKAKAKGKKKG